MRDVLPVCPDCEEGHNKCECDMKSDGSPGDVDFEEYCPRCDSYYVPWVTNCLCRASRPKAKGPKTLDVALAKVEAEIERRKKLGLPILTEL